MLQMRFPTSAVLLALVVVDAALCQQPASRPRPTVTVSKQTTFFLGPLTEDGYVDFRAALNAHFRKGIRPQKNAMVGLLQAIGPSPEGVALLERRGIDLGRHASQPLTEQLLNFSDHVYTMTHSHREAILRFRPDLAERVELLSRNGRDVVDPIGGGMGEYERCEAEIEENLHLILESHSPERLAQR